MGGGWAVIAKYLLDRLFARNRYRHRQSRFIVARALFVRSGHTHARKHIHMYVRTHAYTRLSGAYGRKVHRLRVEVTPKIITVMKSGLYRAVDRAVTRIAMRKHS